ncbi:MAG: ROK family protein [Candidatus Paceibacterota bacterium]
MHIVFDIGGTKMRLAGVRDLAVFGQPVIVDTPKDFRAGFALLVEMIKELSEGEKIEMIAGGIAGPVDKETGTLLASPNLAGWIGQPLKTLLAEEFSAKCFIRNDTAMVGLGETVAGAGRGGEIVAYITVSTGVGGARIVHRRIDETVFGFEPGHQIINLADWHDGEGHNGHLDSYISGQAVTARFGKKPYLVTDPAVWQEAAQKLAAGLYNTILHWSPDILVVGGSMMKQPGIDLAVVHEELKKLMRIFPALPDIRPAILGDFGGLHGARYFLAEENRVGGEK